MVAVVGLEKVLPLPSQAMPVGGATPTETFEAFNNTQNVSNGAYKTRYASGHPLKNSEWPEVSN